MKRPRPTGVIPLVLMFLLVMTAESAENRSESSVDCPNVPRISAQKAYLLYKSGKAILIQADGEKVFKGRRILGALNFDQEAVCQGRMKLPNLPRKGILIITFCF